MNILKDPAFLKELAEALADESEWPGEVEMRRVEDERIIEIAQQKIIEIAQQKIIEALREAYRAKKATPT